MPDDDGRGIGHQVLPGAERGRSWLRMLSGRRVHLLDPAPVDIELADLALSLAREPRWNGQTRGSVDRPLSVAIHTIAGHPELVRRLPDWPRRKRRLAIVAWWLHDAPEVVCRDLSTPQKEVLGPRGYHELETRIARTIHIRFGLPVHLPEDVEALVKEVDLMQAAREAWQYGDWSEGDIRGEIMSRRGWRGRFEEVEAGPVVPLLRPSDAFRAWLEGAGTAIERYNEMAPR